LWNKGTDKRWYCIREYYYSGRDKGVQKTDAEYANSELCSLYVHPDYQSKGVGAALLKRVKDSCSVGNNKTLALFCFKDNPKAVEFYTKHGGTVFKEQKHQFGDKEYDHFVFIFNLVIIAHEKEKVKKYEIYYDMK
jgi:ribosomal protein S18 acetylase RimI-like enzyme